MPPIRVKKIPGLPAPYYDLGDHFLRFDEDQNLTPEEQERARDNIGAVSDADVKAQIPIYEFVSEMDQTPVPDDIHTIRVNNDSAAGDGLGGSFSDTDNGTPVAFTSAEGEGAVARDWYRVEDVSLARLSAPLVLDADLTITVGPGGDYSTINEALEFLSQKAFRLYQSEGRTAMIDLLDGFVMSEQVIVTSGIDFGWVTIRDARETRTASVAASSGSYTATVPSAAGLSEGDILFANNLLWGTRIENIAGVTLTLNKPAEVTGTATARVITPFPLVRSALSQLDAEGGMHFPAFAAVGVGAVLPRIGALFWMDETGAADFRTGILTLNGAKTRGLQYGGVMNAGYVGSFCQSAYAMIDGMVFDYAQTHPTSSLDEGPIYFAESASGSCRSASACFAQNGSGIYVNQASNIAMRRAIATDCARNGVMVNYSSEVSGRDVIADRAGDIGFVAYNKSGIELTDARAIDCGSDTAVLSAEASTIQADGFVANGMDMGRVSGGGKLYALGSNLRFIQPVGYNHPASGVIYAESLSFSVVDDAVAIIPVPGLACNFCVSFNIPNASFSPAGPYSARLTSTASLVAYGDRGVNFSIIQDTPLDGTTGDDGKFTMSVSDNVLYIENRSGSARFLSVDFTSWRA